MIRSLRWRLLIWYTCLLLAVVGGFGSILFFQTRASKLQEIDSQLVAAALNLDAKLGKLPPWELDSKDLPPFKEFKDKRGPKFGPPPGGKKGGPRFPMPKDGKDPVANRERALAELTLPPELEGPAGLPEDERTYFAIWRGDASVLKATRLPDGVSPPPLDDANRPRIQQRGDHREVSMRGQRKTRLVVGRSVAKEISDLRAFVWQLAGIGTLVLVVGLAGGWWLASRIFRPIDAMSAAAAAISGTNLSTRIETANVDVELAGLAQVLNAMFARLEAAFERQQQFTADASHELRTPLAILRANAELALSASRSPEEYRQTIETCLRAGNRMAVLVQGLLTLARADAGNPGIRIESVRLDEVIAECLTLLKPLADGREITLTADLAPATIAGDPDQLAQLVSNLVSNAIQHNHVGGKVHVALSASADSAVLAVSDTGPGIPEQDRARIFERFFRVDKARARASGGTGLGLAICKAIADAHGGRLDFDSTENAGATFRVVLPRREEGIRA